MNLSVNLDNLFNTLMKDSYSSRNNKVARVLNSKNNRNSSKELKLSKNKSKFMEVSDTDEYSWGIIGESSCRNRM